MTCVLQDMILTNWSDGQCILPKTFVLKQPYIGQHKRNCYSNSIWFKEHNLLIYDNL